MPNEGAPSDFGGPVLPNPKNLKPKLDTENPDYVPLLGQAKTNIDLAPGDSAKMDITNPPPAPKVRHPLGRGVSKEWLKKNPHIKVTEN